MSENPFKIDLMPNEKMGCFDVCLQVGGLKDRQEAERFAKILAEWLAGESGWIERVQ
jgi:hypothetical protein